MLRPTPKGVTFEGNERFEGFTIDLLHRISKDLQFKYQVILSPGNAYGQKDKNGQWNGIVGAIKARVSIGLASKVCSSYVSVQAKNLDAKRN